MKRYKLSTGLWEVNEKPEFENDSDAWEYLRHSLPNKFATLYREEVVLPLEAHVFNNTTGKYL